MKLSVGRRRKAGGPGLARHRFNPKGESLERRQLLASPIEFNPTGNGNPADTFAIRAFDWAPGNSLAVSSVPLTVGDTFQLDYQATLADLIDPNSNSFVPPGLNSTYQITAVASITEVVTSLNANGSVATFALAPTQSPNSFFEIYYNPAVVASDLAGTGFNVGTLILAASPNPTLANSGNFALALNGGNPIIQPFDQFDAANYPGITTVTGTGSATLDGNVSSVDPAFFETNLAQISFDTNNTTPFLETDPSMLFVGSPGGGAPNVTPNIGTINGVNGTDFQFQADANSAFTTAPPTLATTPSPTSVTLGTTPVTLFDSAVLSAGFTPTGTITFTLVAPGGGTVDTETATVSGNGTYTTPTGYTLPTTGTVTGTYQWDASYSGDSNNLPASDVGATDEQVPVTPASPSVATTASGPVTLPSGPPGTVILSDSAVLSGGYFPTGSITFTLSGPDGFSFSHMDTVSGNGTYTASDTLPTTGTVAGTYTWSATYSGDANNNSFTETGSAANGEQTVVTPASPSVATTASGPVTLPSGPPGTVTLSDSAVLSGGYHPTGSITFTLSGPDGFSYSQMDPVSGNGTYMASDTLPTAGTYTWSATYSGDANNNGFTETGSAANGEQTVVSPSPGSPAITTTPSPTSVTLGTTTVTLFDSAVLSGGYFPTGTITFTLVAPSGGTVDTETVPVSGNGTYTTPKGYTLTSATATGTYQWDATYTSANGNNASASDVNSSTERVKVCPTVVNVERFGVHMQPMQIVVTFSAQVNSAQAENINNYHLDTRAPNGTFSVPVRVTSAVYNPATNSVTLSFAHSFNVHHFGEVTVTNPCPGCPSFSGILNRKYSLGYINDHGRIIYLPKTDIPGVLNPSVLPKAFTPANRRLVLKLAKEPQSGAFYQGTPALALSASRRTVSSGNREGRGHVRRLIRILSRSGSGTAVGR